MDNNVNIRITASAAQAQAEMARLSGNLDRLRGALAHISHYAIGGLGLAGVVSGAARAADAMTNLQSKLRLVDGTLARVAISQQNLIAIAQATRQPLEAAGEIYHKMAKGAETLNLSQQQTIDLTRTISQAMALSGSSAESSRAALMQFGQALASGTLRGEELNSVLEQAPALAEAIAKGMGKNVGELRALAEQGKLTVQDLVGALQKSAPEVASQFGKLAPTIAGAFTQLDNAMVAYVGRLSEASGAGQAFAASVQFVADHLGAIASGALVAVSAGLGVLIGRMVATGIAARAMAAQSAAAFAGMATQVAALNIAGAGMPIWMGRVAGALRLIGGWPGLITTALAGGVAAWGVWGASAESASDRAAAALQRVREEVVKTGKTEIEVLRETRAKLLAERTAAEQRTGAAKGAAQRGERVAPGEFESAERARAAAQERLAVIDAEIKEVEAREQRLANRTASEAWKTLYRTREQQRNDAIEALNRSYTAELERVKGNAAEVERVARDYLTKKDELARLYADRKTPRSGSAPRGAPAFDRFELRRELDATLDDEEKRYRARRAEIDEAIERDASGADVLGRFERTGDELDAVRQRLDAEVTIGTKSRTQAQVELREETARLGQGMARDLLPRLQELASLAPDDATREKWRALAAEILAMQAAGRDVGWIAGMRRGLEDFAIDASDAFGGVRDAVSRAFAGMTEALTTFVMTGKLSVRELVDSILRDLLRIQIQQSITGPLASMISAILPSFGGSAATGGGIPFDFSRALANATGNVFRSPSLHAYVDQIRDTPTHFALGSGPLTFARGGVFGEAGPEAIMPLARDGAGRLGVRAQGGGSSEVRIDIHNYSGAPVTQRDSTDSRGGRRVEVTIGEMAAAEMRRPGSALNNAARGGFGLQPAMIGR